MALPKRYQKCRKVPKSAVLFSCTICDYYTSHKSHYTKHLQTKKHLKKALPNVTKMLPKVPKSAEKVYICENCEKEYKSRKGLWSHKKKCISLEKIEENNDYLKLMKAMGQNINLKDEIIKCKDETIEAYKNGMGNNNTINSNNTNNISINVFLDEHCKDAKTLQDFISQISFKLEDVLSSNYTIKDGITNVVIKNLEDLPKTERPIHCTDEKRTNFVVKDKDYGWIKDTGGKHGKIYSEVEKLRMNAYVELNEKIDEKFPDPKSDDIYSIKSSVTESLISENVEEIDKRNVAVIKEIAKAVNIKDAIDEIK
tara:strand:+ start:723 stop:1658 length:936 start_codon:yes stop_codon:yes gene_type:complete